jgi:hypothetical protein
VAANLFVESRVKAVSGTVACKEGKEFTQNGHKRACLVFMQLGNYIIIFPHENPSRSDVVV